MNEDFKTEQECFWAGSFGDDYTERNDGAKLGGAKINLFSRILKSTDSIKSVLEFGANKGLNLRAIKYLIPEIKMKAVEINKKAARECLSIPDTEVFCKSILDYSDNEKSDMVFTCGVLIHIAPKMLNQVYELMYEYSKKYILISEYYNPTPLEIEYRGNKEKLYKRDWAGEFMDKYSDVRLRDYGFVYHRDNMFPLDDLTWFLIEKQHS